jgi:predicted PurR-regulated permease PerM
VRTVAEPLEVGKLWSTYGPVVETAAGLALALVLVIFMLIRREDLRDRVISCSVAAADRRDQAGQAGSASVATSSCSSRSTGVRRDLRARLLLIGMPYALTRVSSCGAALHLSRRTVGDVMPLGLSVLFGERGPPPLLVVGLFVALELVTAWWSSRGYGRRVGISETATLVMVAFWTRL